MRQARRLRELVGLEVVVLLPCLLPVRANMVKWVGLGGRAHLAMEACSAPEDAVGRLVAVT